MLHRTVSRILEHSLILPDHCHSVLPSDIAIDRVAFLNAAFAAYSRVVGCCEPEERLDLALVALQVYLGKSQNCKKFAIRADLHADLLKDETSREDLVGPTLPVLKAMLDSAQTSATAPGLFPKVVHSILSACITNLDDMRGRQGPSVMLKVKNNMLAIVLVATTTRPGVALSRVVLEEACYIVGQRMEETEEVSRHQSQAAGGPDCLGYVQLHLTAIQCAKALLMSAARGNANLQSCVAHILPDMIRYLSTASTSADNLNPKSPLWAGAKEIVQTLVAFVTTVDAAQSECIYRQSALHANRSGPLPERGGYAVLLPTLILLLDPDLKSNLAHDLATSQLLDLAVKDPAAFKDATAALDDPIRLRLESAVRQAVTSRQSGQKAAASAKPQISLKSFSS